jgi:hypothetical protein
MKTVADLKRAIKVGTVIIKTKHTLNGIDNDGGRTVGYERKVTHVNTVGIGMITSRNTVSYLDWPKKDNFQPIENGFRITDWDGALVMEYVIVKDGSNAGN